MSQSHKRVFNNAGWSLVGAAGPLFAAIIAIPLLLNLLGNEGFGIVSLIWALIGYFGIFDFGIGRALTYQISRVSAGECNGCAIRTLHAGILVTVLTGFIGMIGVLALADVLVDSWLNISTKWRDDALLAFQIAALGIVPATVASGLRGALEGFGRFATANLIRLSFGCAMFILPAISVTLHGPDIGIIATYLVVARLFVLIASIIALRSMIVAKWNMAIGFHNEIKALFSYGGWVTLSGVVGPIMVYGDRFFVGAAVGIDQLPLYSIPQEGLQRLLILPGALCAALLPLLSSAKPAESEKIYRHYYSRIAWVMAVVCVVAIIFAGPVLDIWIGEAFSKASMPIVIILTVGIFINSLAQLPYTYIHAKGKPRITAILHVIELVVYVFAVYILATKFGLVGAALAWVFRVILDYLLLEFVSRLIMGKKDR